MRELSCYVRSDGVYFSYGVIENTFYYVFWDQIETPKAVLRVVRHLSHKMWFTQEAEVFFMRAALEQLVRKG